MSRAEAMQVPQRRSFFSHENYNVPATHPEREISAHTVPGSAIHPRKSPNYESKGIPENSLVGKGCLGVCVPVRCVEATLDFWD